MRKTALTLLTAASAAALVATTTPALAAHEELVVTGLAQNGKLVTFLAGTGERLSQTDKITGIAQGEQLVAIDYRPLDGALYGVAVDGTSASVYVIDDASAQATPLGVTFPITGSVSIDFNPQIDRLRVVSSDEDNYVINPVVPGASRVTDLSYGDDRDPGVAGAAYTNNVAGTATTQLFDVDATEDTLITQANSAGTLVTVGALGIDIGPESGFDIYSEDGANIALLSDRGPGSTRVYTVNLITGAVNVTPTSGVSVKGSPVLDIAVDPGQ